jgi:hypothetical protein
MRRTGKQAVFEADASQKKMPFYQCHYLRSFLQLCKKYS